jgi:endonuclease/exonuclease/phosphatase family metal-dependent hydrolase
VALLLARIGARDPKGPVVVTGDFNAGEDNPAAVAMRAVFRDSFRLLHPDAGDAGTFNGFKVGQTGGDKIDFVFVEPGTDLLDAAIVRTARDGRYPSDHFPVTARIRFR